MATIKKGKGAKKSKTQPKTMLETMLSMRREWPEGFDPRSKTVQPKKGKGSFKRKDKHPKRYVD